MVQIAVIDDYQGTAKSMADWDSIPGSEVWFFHEPIKDSKVLVETLEHFEIIVMMRERTLFPADVIERLPRLKLLAGTGGRQAHVDFQAAERNNILVCGTGGGGGNTTAELAWGLLISLLKGIVFQDNALRKGQWQTGLVYEIAGKTLGIMGLGRIGTQMASFAHAFQMPVIAWGPTLTHERATQSGVTYVPWEKLFAQSDVLTIHVPLTDLSRGWITSRELNMMKPTSYLINTSRGPIIQEPDLLEALRTGTIAGAGLDVYDQEPLQLESPLLSLGNVVVTPHLGYATEETLRLWYSDTVGNINAYLAGKPRNIVNPPRNG